MILILRDLKCHYELPPPQIRVLGHGPGQNRALVGVIYKWACWVHGSTWWSLHQSLNVQLRLIYICQLARPPHQAVGLSDKSCHSGEGQMETSETVCLSPLLCSPARWKIKKTNTQKKKPYPILEGRQRSVPLFRISRMQGQWSLPYLWLIHQSGP